ncbi:MAG TPA: 2-phospho-L-lactate guanylyltransferase [Thermoleophilaceae bacterium]|nr:2-phospho-L-lactate guanylyltransferase [Thermoleophilaceae bacterium]
MRTIAILPIKSFDAAKQRLAGLLGSGARQALVQAMFQDVLSSLRHVESLDAIAVVTANPVAARAARGEGVVVLGDSEETGHNDAAGLGIAYAVEHGFERVMLVPGDTPLLDPDEIEGVLRDREAGLVVVPDRHGSGTNALLIAPPGAVAPSFGAGSRRRHELLAAAAGVPCSVVPLRSLAVDVDTPEDLDELAALLGDAANRSRASMTRGALRQLDRSGAAPSLPSAAIS